jgi:NAD-dependent SIR2 family protein deacetylase
LSAPDVTTEAALVAAARALDAADALLVTAGAGMGVDSGLPDFRGNEGFWQAYPPFAKLGVSFVDLAQPQWFEDDPHLAWGFYGHRLALYRRTVPHAGFATLAAWAARASRGAHAFTSNIDGQFQRAGWDAERIVECHGSIAHLQCARLCSFEIFAAGPAPEVDESTMRARDPLPRCPHCGHVARPNVLMFGDGDWLSERTDTQQERLSAWLRRLDADDAMARLVVFECGAGTAIPTVRRLGERLAAQGATLVRVNLRESEVPDDDGRGVGLALGAADAIRRIDARRQRTAAP